MNPSPAFKLPAIEERFATGKVGAGNTATRSKILVVDDDPVVCCLCREYLEPAHIVVEAASGAEAMQHLSRGSLPDLILLDIMMPQMDGFELLQHMREHPGLAGLPAIFMTALEDEGTEVHAMEFGVADFITKPLSGHRLLAHINKNLLLAETQRNLLRANAELEQRVADRTQQLVDALNAAHAAGKAKGQFLANISHELRTPMNGILGVTDLLLMEAQAPAQRELTQTLKDSARHLMKILEDLIDYAAMENDKLADPQVQPFSLQDMVAGLDAIFRPYASQANLEFSCQVGRAVPDWRLGDAAMLRRVLLQLLGNAFKFTSAGSVSLHVDVMDSGWLCFSVADSGIGIPAAKLEEVFGPFEQADNSNTRPHGGLGLGLSLAKGHAEMIGGRICLTSEDGNGTRVCVELPLPVAGVVRPDSC